LANTVDNKFGTKEAFFSLLYYEHRSDWRKFYAIHLQARLNAKSPVHGLDETKIMAFNYTYGSMARDIIDRMKLRF
jgi:hypothetical protein